MKFMSDTIIALACWLPAMWILLLPTPTLADGVPCWYNNYIDSQTLPSQWIEDAKMNGSRMYFALEDGGVQIWDISKLESISLLGEYNLEYKADNLEIFGDFIYVQKTNSPIIIVDASAPTSPTQIGTIENLWRYSFAQIGDTPVLVNQEPNTLTIYDLSNPANPIATSSVPFVGTSINTITIGDRYAYFMDTSTDISVVYDLIDIDNPVLVGETTPIDSFPIAIHQGFAYFSKTSTTSPQSSILSAYSISDPLNPTLLGTYETPYYQRGYEFDIDSGLVYVLMNRNGLHAVDISNPASMSFSHEFSTLDDVLYLSFTNDLIYAISSGYQIEIIDPSPPGSDPVLGTFEDMTLDEMISVDDLGITANGSDGLLTIDLSDPLTPSILGSDNTSNRYRGITKADGFAYAFTDSTMFVIDLQDPTNPTHTGSIEFSKIDIESISVSGNHAYLACGSHGVVTVDISDPTTPTFTGLINPAGYAIDIHALGSITYVANYNGGFTILDTTNPQTPIVLSTLETLGYVQAVDVVGTIAYLTDSVEGIMAVDLSNPLDPQIISTYLPQSYPYNFTFHAQIAYFPSVTGLRMVDFSDQMNPVEIGWHNTFSLTGDISIHGNIGYTSSRVILDLSRDCTHCPADFTSDGMLNFFDISAFITAYINNEPAADFSDDGLYNFFDISLFLQSFGAGCP